jgi:hypothetical protein
VRDRFAIALTCASLAACSGSAPVTGKPFDPIEFFTGHTQGSARLNTITGGSHTVSVDSHGTADGHGGLVLDQKIVEQGQAPRVRRWVLHPAGPDRWAGSLTDADGPVAVERTPVDVTIRYRMRNGATVEQHLQRPPTGAVENHMIVKRFGLRLARLDEKIQKGRG